MEADQPADYRRQVGLIIFSMAKGNLRESFCNLSLKEELELGLMELGCPFP